MNRFNSLSPLSPRLSGLAVAVLAFAVDRLSKIWVLAAFAAEGDKIAITGFFDLVMSWNRGISYGLLASASNWRLLMIILLTAALIIWCLLWLWRADDAILAGGLGAIIGGGLGNLYDRFAYGAVADFISLHLGDFYWYVFNVADVMICLGAAALIARQIFRPKSAIRES